MYMHNDSISHKSSEEETLLNTQCILAIHSINIVEIQSAYLQYIECTIGTILNGHTGIARNLVFVVIE